VTATRDEAEEFTRGLGTVYAGSWRLTRYAVCAGIPAALGLTTSEWVEQRLGGYVKLDIEQRREAVAELVADGMTQREIADVLGVSHQTVGRDVCPDGPPDDDDLPERSDVGPDGPHDEREREHAHAAQVPLTVENALELCERLRQTVERINVAETDAGKLADLLIALGTLADDCKAKFLPSERTGE